MRDSKNDKLMGCEQIMQLRLGQGTTYLYKIYLLEISKKGGMV